MFGSHFESFEFGDWLEKDFCLKKKKKVLQIQKTKLMKTGSEKSLEWE